MMKQVWIAALFSTSALAGCGSHNHAPIVYGTAPTAEPARVYTSPEQIAAERRAAANAIYASSTPDYSEGITPAVATSRLAPLTPVVETAREGRFDYDAQPVYLAQAEPIALSPIPDSSAGNLPGQVTVQPGDTVYAISRRTGASPQAIIALNSLAPPYALSVGQTIRVPSNSVPPSRSIASAPAAAPIQQPAQRAAGSHVVRSGETLYSISRSTGVSVADLAAANRLRAPYSLSVGQALAIPGARIASAPARAQENAPDVADLARNVSYDAAPVKPPSIFDWPVQGAIIGSYGMSDAGKRNDGVNIAAPVGTPVRAAADGEVVYRGSELEGYGNLLLIKHEDGFVTAYAHNDAMLVKKGDRVRQGQVIAKVGQTGSAKEPQLHFEIRQNLKAVDPVALLGSL
jgi:murein DD-endopeptidase MepM/ murein hydrolase activator NlpD